MELLLVLMESVQHCVPDVMLVSKQGFWLSMKQDRVVLEFNFYGYYGGGMAGSIFGTEGISPTLTTCSGGGRIPMVRIVYESE